MTPGPPVPPSLPESGDPLALLPPGRVSLIFGDSQTDFFGLILLKRVNTGDTVDVSPWFSDAKLATVLWTTTAKADKLATPVGNIVTISTTGLANDGGWLSVWGTAS